MPPLFSFYNCEISDFSSFLLLIFLYLLFPIVYFSQLYLIISMLLHKEEDGKAEDGKAEDIDKEQDCVPTIISMFHSIKQSEDVTDATKSKVGKRFS